jgi:hypothetical protein
MIGPVGAIRQRQSVGYQRSLFVLDIGNPSRALRYGRDDRKLPFPLRRPAPLVAVGTHAIDQDRGLVGIIAVGAIRRLIPDARRAPRFRIVTAPMYLVRLVGWNVCFAIFTVSRVFFGARLAPALRVNLNNLRIPDPF